MPERQVTRWRHGVQIAAATGVIAIGAGAAIVGGSGWPSVAPNVVTTPAASTHLCDAPSSGHTAWYVKNGGAGSNSGSSWTNAWTSFAGITWASVQPGDTLYIDGGPLHAQVYAQTMNVGASGAALNPVTICPGQDTGHNGIVRLDYASVSPVTASLYNAIDTRGQDYVVVSGDYLGINHLEIENLYSTAERTAAVGVADSDGASDHITVDHVHFLNVNNGVRFSGAPDGTLIENNDFDGTRGDASVSFGDGTLALDSILITHNTFRSVCHDTSYPTGTCGGPDGVQTTNGTTISYNTFTEETTTVATSNQHPDTIQNPASNVKVYGNVFTNLGDSNFDFDTYKSATPHDVYVYNNVFRSTTHIDLYPDFIRVYHNVGLGVNPTSFTNIVIANNVFVDADWGTNIPAINVGYYGFGAGATPTATGCRFTNNIFVNDGDSLANNGFTLYVSSDAGSWTADHNVYYRATDARVSWLGTTYTAASFVASVDTLGSTSLPLFNSYVANSSDNDFRLQSADTVAHDKGADLSTYFTTDLLGVTRPVGGIWDIGPYER